MHLADRAATETLGLPTVALNVRSYNLPAYKLDLSEDYVEFERTGDLIRMRKDLIKSVS